MQPDTETRKAVAKKKLGALTSAKRKALPESDFVFPDKRSYPIPDAGHARAALARGAAHATPAQYAKIKAAVRKKFPNMAVK